MAADDLMDVFCYVVFRACEKVSNFSSLANWAQVFLSVECEGEQAYYFTCLQLSLAHVASLSWPRAAKAAALVAQAGKTAKKKTSTLLVAERAAFLARHASGRTPAVRGVLFFFFLSPLTFFFSSAPV